MADRPPLDLRNLGAAMRAALCLCGYNCVMGQRLAQLGAETLCVWIRER